MTFSTAGPEPSSGRPRPSGGRAVRQRPAGRYGGAVRPGGQRRWTTAAVLALLIAVVWALWAALTNPSSTTDAEVASFSVVDAAHVRVSLNVSLPTHRVAVCRVQALNAALVEVGRQDVRIGPSSSSSLRVTTQIPTTQLATTVTVQACAVQGQ